MLTRPSLRALALSFPLVLLASCGTGTGESPAAPTSSSTPTPEATEVAAGTPRLALTYDGGVEILDATSLEKVGGVELPGFLRINDAGDGRHVAVTTPQGFRILDAGTWAEPHGDHSHYYTAEPRLTDVTWPATKGGHVVVHDERTVFFDDGTGEVLALDSDDVADPDAPTRTYRTPHAHHGVAVERADGTLLVTEGTEESRSGARLLDADDTEIAASADCPGVHGESAAAGGILVVGCQNGAILAHGDHFDKVTAPDAYGRIGNQAGSEDSPIVLGDYKVDEDAELERPTRVSLIDTRTAALRLVDLPASYSFRSLARDEDGAALVLGTDGALHVVDPGTGTLTRSIPVVAPWEEPLDWQDPRPTVKVHDGIAYVTEPATSSLHAVDLAAGAVWKTVELDVVPNELTPVSGE